jgi:hypothetical protein
MAQFTMNIDTELRDKFKSRCLENNTAMSEVLISYIKDYVGGVVVVDNETSMLDTVLNIYNGSSLPDKEKNIKITTEMVEKQTNEWYDKLMNELEYEYKDNKHYFTQHRNYNTNKEFGEPIYLKDVTRQIIHDYDLVIVLSWIGMTEIPNIVLEKLLEKIVGNSDE